MMAVWWSSGALLLVLLTGVSHCAPTKKDFDPSSSYGGGHGAYAGSGGSGGFGWEGSSHGHAAAAAAPVARPAFEPVSHPGHSPASYGQPTSSQPVAPRNPPAVSYSSNSFAAPTHSGPVGNFYAGPAQPDVDWEVPPPRPLSGDQHYGAHGAATEGPSNVSPPGPPAPVYTGGELSQYEHTVEHGNSESESEEQGYLPPPAYEGHSEDGGTSGLYSAGPTYSVYGWPWYMDYMFLTGQYPPGTVTHSSSSWEEGDDHWHDAHYLKYHYPSYPITQQVKTFPADFKAPEPVKQPSQPIKQGFGYPSVVPSGAVTGPTQPSGAGRVYHSYSGPGVFEQPRQPAGSFGSRKMG